MFIHNRINGTTCGEYQTKHNPQNHQPGSEKQLRALLQFTGIADDDTENKSIQELKSVKARKYALE